MSKYIFNMNQYGIILEEMLKEPSLKYFHRLHLVKESYLKEDGATLASHASVVQQIRNIIHSGQFCSMAYVKADGSLRFFNIHKEPMSAVEKLQGMPRYDPADHNLLRIWDNNAIKKTNDANGLPMEQRGDWRSAKIDGIIYFKRGKDIYDFTQVNQSKISQLPVGTIESVKQQMGIIDNESKIINVQ